MKMSVKNGKIKDRRQGSEKDPLWRVYMNWYLENEKRLERDDKFDQRQPGELSKLGYEANNIVEVLSPSREQACCFPLDTLNQSERNRLPDRLNHLDKIRIWRNIKAFQPHTDDGSATFGSSEQNLWPCLSRDLHEEQRQVENLIRRKLMRLLPCQESYHQDSNEKDDFIHCKELGHARIPVLCQSEEKLLLVDRASGERAGLVDGDYTITEGDDGIYTGVCLRAINKGMHLIELSEARVRENSCKFCFYQAIVALLAKTQLRYKYATSANIDYIYDQAWILFIHIGSINFKSKIQLDDIVIYNYKYSVVIELVSGLELLIDESVKYSEGVKNMKHAKRPELMKVPEPVGWEKISSRTNSERIEEFLHNLPKNCKNFILRCCRFSLGFWKDANFWYLYNPYRCDSFGYWDGRGNACIMKFTSRSTLNRHIVILLLRAHAYHAHGIKISWETSKKPPPSLVIQLFKITYNCVKIHNLKFLQDKCPQKGRLMKVIKEESPTTSGSELVWPSFVEKRIWLDKYDINWRKCMIDGGNNKKFKWHEYYVAADEEETPGGKVFSLWGEIHPTEKLFSLENRGNQVYACYVVAAGMIRIMAPEYWTPKTLDTIVMCGDRYYTLSRLQSQVTMMSKSLSPAHLLRYFKIGGIFFENDVMKPLDGKLYSTSQSPHSSLWKMLHILFSKHSFAILSCENCCVGVFKLSGAYFMLDVNSVGPPVFNLGDGAGYLIRLTSFKKFLITLLLSIGSRESSHFHLYPVEILKIIEMHP